MKKLVQVAKKEVAQVDSAEKLASEFNARIEAAIASDDPVKIAKAQLEVSFSQLQYLQRIDWKVWELYNKFINW